MKKQHGLLAAALLLPGLALADIGLNPSSVDFGDVLVGQTKNRLVLVDNIMGDGPVTIVTVAVPGNSGATGFGMSANQCDGLTLQVGDACQIILTFTPDRTTPYNHVLLIRYEQDGKKKTETLSLDGRGI